MIANNKIMVQDILEVPEDLMGRDDIWNSLCGWAKSHNPSCQYLWGSAGTGKTFLMRHVFHQLSKRAAESVFWTSAGNQAQSSSAWIQHVSRLMGLSTEPITSIDNLTDLLIARCSLDPFMWIIDDFDQMKSNRDWAAATALELSARGASVILAGRTSPLQLWPTHSYMRGQIQIIEIDDLDHGAAEALLASRGLTDPLVVNRAIEISHGRPQLLSAIADGLSLLEETAVPADQWAFMTNPVDTAGYLIEQICHPGSRRLIWRAGHPTDRIDTMIAAASLTPMFNRDWLARVVGRTLVNELWEEFVALPFLHPYRGGYYGVFPRLREEIAQTVLKVRPWMWENWTRSAVSHYLARVQAGSTPREHAWELLSRFVRPHLGESIFSVDVGSLVLNQQLPSRSEEGFVHLTDRIGVDVASTRLMAPTTECLVVDTTRWDANNPEALVYLVSNIANRFHLYNEVEWVTSGTSPALDSLLATLKFSPVNECRWNLTLGPSEYLKWLENLVAAPEGTRPRDPVALVQSVLLGLKDGMDEFSPEVMEYWNSVSTDASNFRTWFLDALNSADLGDQIDGKTVLVLYYLDRRGTHEELAEILHVSRATYFRNHRAALERLAQAVFQ